MVRRSAAVISGVAAVAVLGAAVVHAQAAPMTAGPPTKITLQSNTSDGAHTGAPTGKTVAGQAFGAKMPQPSPTSSMSPQDMQRSAATLQEAGSLRSHALRFRTLDDPADPTFNQLLGINDEGRVVGYFGSGADAAHPNKGFRIRSPYTRFVNENVPGSVQTQVVGINNEGVNVGFSVDGGGATTGFVDLGGRFVPVSDPMTDPAAPFTQLLGVNGHGRAVGFYNDRAGAAHGFVYNIRSRAFTPVTLPVTADAVTATGINDDGDVSGFYTVGKTTTAFQLEHTGRFARLSFGQGTNTQALGINDADQVVGSFVDATGAMRGFLFSHGRLTQVNDPNGAQGTVVNGLNNEGQLVGFFVDAAGNTHGLIASARS
jgi:uncharacterized membrane protein